jgi:hypothetical protein
MFENPDRPPAWEVRDPGMLQAQGQHPGRSCIE